MALELAKPKNFGSLVALGLLTAAGIALALNLQKTPVYATLPQANPVATVQTLNQPLSNAGEPANPNNGNWRPPEKNYCGQSMETYFAELLLDQTAAMLSVKSGSYDSPLTQNLAKYSDHSDSVGQMLRQNNCYFYDGGGSVFSDYKIMRGEYYLKLGQQAGFDGEEAMTYGYNQVLSQLNLNMPTDQAFNTVLGIVKTWWP